MPRLAIIDDHEALREGLQVLLGHGGLEVVGTAGNVAAAEDLIEHTGPDVALIDIALPDGSGIDLTRHLLARFPELRIVLYTGDADSDLLSTGLDSGAHGYALKAGSMVELVEAIEKVAAGEKYVDPRLDRVVLSQKSTREVAALSNREREIVALMAEGTSMEQIAIDLQLSIETIRTHVRNVIRKMRARNRVHAIAIALERGEIALDDHG